MAYYHDTDTTQQDTMTVHESDREALVRYPRQDGGTFTVRIRQKPNPIGFHARLPGDKK